MIRNIHRAYLDAGADYVDHELVPVDAAAARGVGAGRADARAQPRRGRAGARDVRRVRDRRLAALRGRLDGPDRHAALGQRPDAVGDHASGAGRAVPRADHRPARRRRRPAADRDDAGHPRDARGHHRRPARVRARPGRRVPLQVSGRARRDRPHAARHRHRRRRRRSCARMRADIIGTNCSVGPEHLREPVRYSVPERRPAGLGDPERRHAAERRRRGRLPDRAAEELAEQMAAFVRDSGAEVVGGCCGTTPEHIAPAASRPSAPPREAPAPGVPAGDRVGHDAPSRCDQEPAADDRRRARQHAGLAQDQGAACSPTTTTACSGRARPGRGRRARARRLRGADRARRRGRPDGGSSPRSSRWASRRR